MALPSSVPDSSISTRGALCVRRRAALRQSLNTGSWIWSSVASSEFTTPRILNDGYYRNVTFQISISAGIPFALFNGGRRATSNIICNCKQVGGFLRSFSAELISKPVSIPQFPLGRFFIHAAWQFRFQRPCLYPPILSHYLVTKQPNTTSARNLPQDLCGSKRLLV